MFSTIVSVYMIIGILIKNYEVRGKAASECSYFAKKIKSGQIIYSFIYIFLWPVVLLEIMKKK